MISILLAQGADPNARDNWNFTPLHEAAIKGKIDVCISESPLELSIMGPNLLSFVVPLSKKCVFSFRVCLISISFSFVALMQNKADCSIRNTDGKTALDLSDPSTHLVLTGEYRKEELLEAARTGNTGVLMALLTPLNVNCHAGDGRKVGRGLQYNVRATIQVYFIITVFSFTPCCWL